MDGFVSVKPLGPQSSQASTSHQNSARRLSRYSSSATFHALWMSPARLHPRQGFSVPFGWSEQ